MKSFYACAVVIATLVCSNGCSQPTDADLFQKAVDEVANGNSLEIAIGSHRNITDDDLARLEGLQGLEKLTLDGSRIGDKGLAHLAKARSLKSLSLNSTHVTDAGIAELKQLHHL